MSTLTSQSKNASPRVPVEVSGFRKAILQGAGRDMKVWAYGQRNYGLLAAPHREFYTDADAAAVCEYVNGRVSP